SKDLPPLFNEEELSQIQSNVEYCKATGKTSTIINKITQLIKIFEPTLSSLESLTNNSDMDKAANIDQLKDILIEEQVLQNWIGELPHKVNNTLAILGGNIQLLIPNDKNKGYELSDINPEDYLDNFQLAIEYYAKLIKESKDLGNFAKTGLKQDLPSQLREKSDGIKNIFLEYINNPQCKFRNNLLNKMKNTAKVCSAAYLHAIKKDKELASAINKLKIYAKELRALRNDQLDTFIKSINKKDGLYEAIKIITRSVGLFRENGNQIAKIMNITARK
ncbi:hypothetical protein ACFL5G_05665, partial [Candidatus Margulisiibacteriota bacterium]